MICSFFSLSKDIVDTPLSSPCNPPNPNPLPPLKRGESLSLKFVCLIWAQNRFVSRQGFIAFPASQWQTVWPTSLLSLPLYLCFPVFQPFHQPYVFDSVLSKNPDKLCAPIEIGEILPQSIWNHWYRFIDLCSSMMNKPYVLLWLSLILCWENSLCAFNPTHKFSKDTNPFCLFCPKL